MKIESPLATGHFSNQKSKHASSGLQEGLVVPNTKSLLKVSFTRLCLFGLLTNIVFDRPQRLIWECIDQKPRRH